MFKFDEFTFAILFWIRTEMQNDKFVSSNCLILADFMIFYMKNLWGNVFFKSGFTFLRMKIIFFTNVCGIEKNIFIFQGSPDCLVQVLEISRERYRSCSLPRVDYF